MNAMDDWDHTRRTLEPEVIVLPQATGLAVLGLQFVEAIDGEVYKLNGLNTLGCKIIG